MVRRPLLLAAAFAAYALSQYRLALPFVALEPNLLRLQLAFSAADYWRILAAWGPEGLAAYRAHFAHDALHLVLYGALGPIAATSLWPPGRGRRRFGLLLPCAAAFDAAENTLQLALLGGPFGFPSPLIPLSAACAAVKWTLAALFALALAHRVLRLARRRLAADEHLPIH